MIKLIKSTNEKLLELFHQNVILLIFKWLETSPSPIYSTTIFNNLTNIYSKEEIGILKIIFRKKKLKKHLNSLLDEVNLPHNNNLLLQIKSIYKYQRKQLRKGNYNIKFFSINTNFHILFIDFFYDSLFNDQSIWMAIGNKSFSKQIFISNFNLKVCPYCNIENISRSRNYKIDHFLPKSKFPLLSMYYLNLIPICEACNSFDQGKGNNFIFPIQNQFYKEIGNLIDFNYNFLNETIQLSASKKEIANFITLLQLENAYKANNLFYLKKNYIYKYYKNYP